MQDEHAQYWIYEYMVTSCMLKALEKDGRHMREMKLNRFWAGVLNRFVEMTEREHLRVKVEMRKSGCRIVSERLTPEHHLHVTYVCRGYEYQCMMMPMVLKARCEDKLQSMAAPLGIGNK